MNHLDGAGYAVLKKNKSLLCSGLDISELLPTAASLGLLTNDECEEIRGTTGKSTAKFVDILLERRHCADDAHSPTGGVQNATDGRRSASGEVNTFKLFVQALEVKEEYKSWANYLQDEYNVMETRHLMEIESSIEESEEVEEEDRFSEDERVTNCHGNQDFQRLSRLSQSVDRKVRTISLHSNNSNTSLTHLQQQQPLSNGAKLLREFQISMKTSERDVRILLYLYGGHCDVVSIRDNSKRSLLHYAAERMRFRAIKMMVEEFNFDPNVQDISGHTPLHLACLAQKVQNVMYLLSVPSCDPNIPNMVGDTPLHMCATIGVDVVTKYLFNCRRVDKNLKNAEGKTGVELMDERCSALVNGRNRDSGAMSPRSENGQSVEEGITKSTEILVRSKRLHTMLVGKNPKGKMANCETWFMPNERDIHKYSVTTLPGIRNDVTLRDKSTLRSECRTPVKKPNKERSREEWLHEVVVRLNLWKSLCFLLTSIAVGVALCVVLAILLIRQNR